jgi:probable HAF family extracellular repeat protein
VRVVPLSTCQLASAGRILVDGRPSSKLGFSLCGMSAGPAFLPLMRPTSRSDKELAAMQSVSQQPIRPVNAITRHWRLVRPVALAGALSACLTATPAAATASTYRVTDLGSLGYGVTHGLAINNNGQVTGYSYLGTAIQIPCPPHKYGPKVCFTHPYHAFVWSNGTMTDLGTLGGRDSRGNAINDLGEVVGTADTANGSSAFTDQNAVMTAINTGDPLAINGSDEIAGAGSFPVAGTPGDVFTQAFTYQNGQTTVLGLLPGEGGIFTGASGINGSGVVVGSGDNSASYERAWKYQNGTMTDIGTLGGPQASATAINANGQIVGFAQTSTDADHGFLWSNGKMTDLGLNFFPAAISDKGVIVGGNLIDSGGALEDLNTLIPTGSPYQIQYANAINNNGQIAADAYDTATHQTHALLLTPN